MSSLQCSNEETPRASKTARVLFETSFDALPDAVALKILLLVPIDARLRIGALLQRRCARVLREPDAWRVIDFGGCEAPVTDRVLLLLCARAGTALRCLDLSGCDVYGARLTTSGIIGALRGSAGLNLECLYTRAAVDYQRYLCRFSRTDAVALRKACPLLQHGDFVLHLHPYLDQPEVASALHALPGDVYLETERNVQTLGSYARGAADSCRALVGLRLELAGYSEAGFKALKDVIVCAKVQELSLHGSPYDADQHSICAALARAFRRSHLQSFDLNARNLRNEVQAVAAVLSDTNCSLAWLRLAATGHGSGPSYAARLAAALAANSSLTELHILDTSLDDDDVSVLAHACVSHTTLQAVCFNGGGISKPLCKTLTTLMAVKTPRPLEWCWAFECMIENQDDEVPDVQMFIAETAQLEQLFYEYCVRQGLCRSRYAFYNQPADQYDVYGERIDDGTPWTVQARHSTSRTQRETIRMHARLRPCYHAVVEAHLRVYVQDLNQDRVIYAKAFPRY